jgi:hypothetical protein
LKPSEKKSDSTLVLVKSGLEGLVLGDGLLLGLLLAKTLLLVRGGVGVEAEHDLLVLERVLLLDVGTLGDGTATDGAEDALNLGAVDELVEVGLGHAVLGEEEVALELRGLGGAAVDGVEGGESVGRPDDETAKVTTRGELEEVEGVDVAALDTGDVAEGLEELLAVLGRVVDDQGAATLDVATVPQLTLTGAELAALVRVLTFLFRLLFRIHNCIQFGWVYKNSRSRSISLLASLHLFYSICYDPFSSRFLS